MRILTVLLLVVVLLLCTVHLPSSAEGAGVLGTSIVGTVINETGVAFPGVQIKAVNVTTAVTFTATCDVGGNYSLPIDKGLYDVTANYVNYTGNVSSVRVLVNTGQEVRLNFTMIELLGTLTGYVTNGTSPIYGVTVILLSNKYNYSGVSVNPFGQYIITKVQPGTYTVMASKVGYYSSDPLPPIEMARDVINHMDFELVEQPAELNGQVFYQGEAVPGVRVQLSSPLFNAETTTDDEGNYSFQMVPVGSYTITFTKDNYYTNTQSVGLSPFEVRHLNVVLEFDQENTTQKFILGFDLAHSLMVMGLTISLTVLIIGLYINNKVRRKPHILEKQEEPSEKE